MGQADEILARGLPTITATDEPLGIPEGFVAPPTRGQQFNALYGEEARADRAATEAQGGQWTPSMPAGPAPQFYERHVLEPAGYAVEERVALQRAMATAGLLTGEYREGMWDQPSQAAYTTLLSYANQNGVDQFAALQMAASSPVVGREQYGKLPYKPPDETALRQQIQALADAQLGRDLYDEELDEFVEAFERADRRRHAAVEANNAALFEQEQTGVAAGELQTEPDPMAKVVSFFNRKYRGAIADTAEDENLAAAGAASQGLSSSMQQVI